MDKNNCVDLTSDSDNDIAIGSQSFTPLKRPRSSVSPGLMMTLKKLKCCIEGKSFEPPEKLEVRPSNLNYPIGLKIKNFIQTKTADVFDNSTFRDSLPDLETGHIDLSFTSSSENIFRKPRPRNIISAPYYTQSELELPELDNFQYDKLTIEEIKSEPANDSSIEMINTQEEIEICEKIISTVSSYESDVNHHFQSPSSQFYKPPEVLSLCYAKEIRKKRSYLRLDIPWRFFEVQKNSFYPKTDKQFLDFFQKSMQDVDCDTYEGMLVSFLNLASSVLIPSSFICELLTYMQSFSVETSAEIYWILMEMLNEQKFPNFGMWSIVEKAVVAILRNQSDERDILLLQYIVTAIASNVETKRLIPGIYTLKKTLAHQIFKNEKNVIELSKWYGEVIFLLSTKSLLTLDNELALFELMELLQILLTVSLAVIESPERLTLTMALQLEKPYNLLKTPVEQNNFFANIINCALIRYNLAQILLKEKFGFTEMDEGCYPFSCSIIVHNYIDRIGIGTVETALEMMMILSYLLNDYCECIQGQLQLPNYKRIEFDQELSAADQAALLLLDGYINELELNLKISHPELVEHPLCSFLLSSISFQSI